VTNPSHTALRKNKRILIITVIVLVISGGLIWHHQTKPYHFQTVSPGVLYRSGCLSLHDLEKVVRQHGIRTIVALNLKSDVKPHPDWYDDEMGFCRQKNIHFVYSPLLGNTPPTNDQLHQWMTLLDDHDNYPILVHCAQGVIRTDMFVAVYDMEYLHMDNQKTLSELPMFGHKLYVPRRKSMRDFILNYNPKWKHDIAKASGKKILCLRVIPKAMSVKR
jgi:protein tyrosine phosphatase (PTP) superfamily phosphohydrolase (DUF442 family)